MKTFCCKFLRILKKNKYTERINFYFGFVWHKAAFVEHLDGPQMK